jgi:CheY-like chemotaxis protein
MNKLRTGFSIIVAEDDDDQRKLYVSMLEALGYNVVCAVCNGAELLEQCSQVQVDVVVVDFDMPVIDGLEAAEEISKKGIPVILISGHEDVANLVVEHEPIVMRMLKPVSMDALGGAIKRALARPSQ